MLGILQRQHFLFDGVARDESIREHAVALADAVGAADGLRLDRRIPPGIEQEHLLRRREIQAHAAGLETDQEELAGGIGLKARDAGFAAH